MPDAMSTAPASASPPEGDPCEEKIGQQEDAAAIAIEEKIGQQEDAAAIAIEEKIGQQEDAAAIAIPTPEKVEGTPWRRKRSTKGVPRFKVMKDQFMKRKATPKTTTPKAPRPAKVKSGKKNAEGNGSQSVGVSGIKSARRKLDFEHSEHSPGEFKAKLENNLGVLAKIHNLGSGKGSKKGKKRKLVATGELQDGGGELAVVPYQKAPADASSSALVPSGNSMQLAIAHRRNHSVKWQTKVLGIDDNTLQVYDALRKWDETDSESFEGVDIGSGPEWTKTREYFEHCVDMFIATVHDLLGPRKFSEWGGSVIDSVVGTFLTQNVADNLSSNAFMTLAAKFPPTKRCINTVEVCSNLSLLIDDMRKKLNLNEQSNGTDSGNSVFTKPVDFEEENGYNEELKGGHYGEEYRTIIENFIFSMEQKDLSTWNDDHLMNMVKDKSGTPICSISYLRKLIATQHLKDTSNWDKLREEAYKKGYNTRGEGTSDSVDWQAVLDAPAVEVANCIEVRGQYYVMALRIKAFLMRVKKDHGNFDLDWLRYVPRESAKNYLLSVLGLGDKSVDCIRLLSLKHKAFPVDVNVARIVTRLGWIKLQPLPFSAEFHLVDLYPIMRDVQRYLWPRLCTISKEKLYELHCLMITFGKVICTKVRPNCYACPFSAKCKYYNSSLARASLPPAEEHRYEHGKEQACTVIPGSLLLSNGSLLLSNGSHVPSFHQVVQHQTEISRTVEREPIRNCVPIIEVPPSPEHEYEGPLNEQEACEDDLCDLEDIIPGPGVQYDGEIDLSSIKHMVNNVSRTPSSGKDLILVNPQQASRPSKKLKNIGRLRTEHNAYVLPDDHAILEEFEERVPEDPCPYLLVVISCPDEHTVKGTILIPSRTATGGNFPLNGTYFQDHEVFADHSSSSSPITVPRECIWNLDRCLVYFGSSIHSITKGQTKQDIKDCFMKGYICVRGFDRNTRCPQRLCTILHATNEKHETGGSGKKRTKTSKEGSVRKRTSQEKIDDKRPRQTSN